MKKSVIAKLLVLCMMLSMLAVPASANLSGLSVGNDAVGSGDYTLTGSAYTITKSGTVSGSITLQAGETLDLGTNSIGTLNVTLYPGATLKFNTSVNTVAPAGLTVNAAPGYGLSFTDGVYSVGASAQSVVPTTTTTNTNTPTQIGTGSSELDVKTTVSGSTVTVQAPTSAEVTASVAGLSNTVVTIDLKDAGANVTTATVPTTLLTEVAALENAVGLTLELPKGDVTFDDAALTSLAAEAGANVSVTLETATDTAALATAQKTALDGFTTSATVSISVTSGDKTISDFGGGTVQLTVPFTPAGETLAENYAGYYVADDGAMSSVPSTFTATSWKFDIAHNSDYVAVYEPYSDVKATYWGAKAIQYAYDNKIMTGMTATTFEPETKLSRAMMVTMLYRLKGASAGAAGQFADVNVGDWYADAVNWAAGAKVASGMGDGTFAPNTTMTREQMAQFLYNYAKANGIDVSKTASLAKFSDSAKVSNWATAAMQWAVAEGYISGMDDGTLAPQGTATRAQVATVFMRYMKANG